MATYKVKYRKSFPGSRMTPRVQTANENAGSEREARAFFKQHHRDLSTVKYEILDVEKVERK